MSLEYQRKIRPNPMDGNVRPDVIIRDTVNDARFLGVVMLILGMGFVGVAVADARGSDAIFAIAGDSLFVLLPGGLYIVASMRIKLGVMAAGLLSMRVGLLQCVACVLAVIASIGLNRFNSVAKLVSFFVPADVICFLIPALIAQAVQLHRAINAMRLLPPVQPGFQIQTVPVPVMMIEQPTGVAPLQIKPLPVVPIESTESEGHDVR